MSDNKAKCNIMRDDMRESVQAFAGRVAHDFNNLLTPLLAYPEMIAAELPENSRANGYLVALSDAANAAACITNRLADLAGAQRSAKRSFDINEVVNAVLAGLRRQPMAQGVNILCENSSGLIITMSQDALSLALEEVCRNALAALRGTGTLVIRVLQRYWQPASGVAVSGTHAPAGVYNVIEVQDTGGGMAEEILRQAFRPFYAGATRRCGGGLGLSIAHCALRENDAFLQLESKDGLGTLATLLLPVSEPFVANTTSAEETDAAPVTGRREAGHRVLVADDEPSIVNLFKLILENYIQGIVVDKASNGVEALALFKAWRYDVIVMDLHMPEMDGQTAFLEIEKHCAQEGWAMPKMVFCTGYAPRDAVKRAISTGDRHTLLNKPVRSEVLVKAVQSRLEMASE
ncbi:MAG TPA: hypothetical protein DCS43_00810 [Verrucomicrobia bacterium]|nr:hypothetical protein [Verrucomicrobiota bacterium]